MEIEVDDTEGETAEERGRDSAEKGRAASTI